VDGDWTRNRETIEPQKEPYTTILKASGPRKYQQYQMRVVCGHVVNDKKNEGQTKVKVKVIVELFDQITLISNKERKRERERERESKV
jgi:type IV secretory pathway component VirB8